MSAKIKEIKKDKEKLVEKALEKDQKLFNLAFDLVLNQLEGEGCPESEEGWNFCKRDLHPGGKSTRLGKGNITIFPAYILRRSRPVFL